MCNQNSKPTYVLCPDGNGGTIPTGYALQNGQLVPARMPNKWVNMTPADAVNRGFTIMNQRQIQDAAAAVGNTGGLLASPYQAVDTPNGGQTGISRLERAGGITGGGITYTLTIKNNNGSAVATYKVFGDWAGTFAIAKGLTAVVGDTSTISGSAGTLSLSHLTARALGRPFRVSQMQIVCTTGLAYFNTNPIVYFNTGPSPVNGPEQTPLPLSALPNADQYNTNIQVYTQSEVYDGINGLLINVPAGEVVTITFTIVSERGANNLVLFGG